MGRRRDSSSASRSRRLRHSRQDEDAADAAVAAAAAASAAAAAAGENPTSGAGERGSEWEGASFKDTLNEARRRAEEARRQMEYEEAQKTDSKQPPPRQEEIMELQLRLAKWNLDSKALNALNQLGVHDALQALRELESKGAGIRNPSAWVCKTATNLRDRGNPKGKDTKQQKHETSTQPQLDIVDHYAALEVEDTADEATIKKAYRKLVLKWHPDKNPEDREVAETKIRAINDAYETLSNATKRETYDAQRQALQRMRRGLGPDNATRAAPRQLIPREFMLQPIGYPDKFVRYGAEKAHASVFVQSRVDARQKGARSGLEDFVPFFKACKLSLWWLPEINNMCRIRALEARTRSSAGEKVVAGRPGGLNLGFHIDLSGKVADSDVSLIEAGKGERNENVNFIVVTSPLYANAYRFEGAFRRGHFLAYRPPHTLKVVPCDGGQAPPGLVIDFTLVNFEAMFKFIDIEEVLRPVMETRRGWVSIDQVKCDPNVIAYFGNILQRPMWEDVDFQTYFEGHFESWEFQHLEGTPHVRLRSADERLGYALQRIRDPDEAATLLIEAGDDLRRLPWRYLAAALDALNRPGSDDLSAVVRRMEAHRRLLGFFRDVLEPACEEATLVELTRLAEALQATGSGSSGEAAAKDVASRASEAGHALTRAVLARSTAWERKGGAGSLEKLPLDSLSTLLTLPGMEEHGDNLVRHAVSLDGAELASILSIVSTAQAANATCLAREAAHAALKRVGKSGAPAAEVSNAVRAIASAGVLLDRCAVALGRRAVDMDAGELSTAICALGEKGHEGDHLAAACRELAMRHDALAKMPSMGLLAVAVAATKSASLAACIETVVTTSIVAFRSWPVADTIKLLLAVVKAKGSALPRETKGALLREAASAIAPNLSELPPAELVRLALAAGGCAGGSSEGRQLLEAVATETGKRLSDLPQAHLMLLTQGLAPLGGAHRALQQICEYWSEVLRDDDGEEDEISKKRKDMERGQALKGDQLAKLAQVLEPLGHDLSAEMAERCFGAVGSKLAREAALLSEASRSTLQEQLRRSAGVGLWKSGKEQLCKALERASSSGLGKAACDTADGDAKKRGGSSASRGRTTSPKRSKKRKAHSSSSSVATRRKKKPPNSSSTSGKRKKRRKTSSSSTPFRRRKSNGSRSRKGR